MQFTTQALALFVGLMAPIQSTLACCSGGCYAVKGESFTESKCGGDLKGTGIANYGSASGCIDIRNTASVKAHNDGCGSSTVDYHFFKNADCPGGPGAGYAKLRLAGGGVCYDKPTDAAYMIVVPGSPGSPLCDDGSSQCGF